MVFRARFSQVSASGFHQLLWKVTSLLRIRFSRILTKFNIVANTSRGNDLRAYNGENEWYMYMVMMALPGAFKDSILVSVVYLTF